VQHVDDLRDDLELTRGDVKPEVERLNELSAYPFVWIRRYELERLKNCLRDLLFVKPSSESVIVIGELTHLFMICRPDGLPEKHVEEIVILRHWTP